MSCSPADVFWSKAINSWAAPDRVSSSSEARARRSSNLNNSVIPTGAQRSKRSGGMTIFLHLVSDSVHWLRALVDSPRPEQKELPDAHARTQSTGGNALRSPRRFQECPCPLLEFQGGSDRAYRSRHAISRLQRRERVLWPDHMRRAQRHFCRSRGRRKRHEDSGCRGSHRARWSLRALRRMSPGHLRIRSRGFDPVSRSIRHRADGDHETAAGGLSTLRDDVGKAALGCPAEQSSAFFGLPGPFHQPMPQGKLPCP